MNVRIAVRSLAAAVVGLSLVSGFAAEGISFAHRPLLAGKASLTADGSNGPPDSLRQMRCCK